jgi:hypothetical protein
MPELTTWLVGNYTTEALEFYNNTLNEEQGEVWLHRGFQRILQQQQQQQQEQEQVPKEKHSSNNNSQYTDTWNPATWWQWIRSQTSSSSSSSLSNPAASQYMNAESSMDRVYTQGKSNTSRIVLICAYLHFNQYLYTKKHRAGKKQYRKRTIDSGNDQSRPLSNEEVVNLLEQRINAYHNTNDDIKSTIFVLAVPTWNPKRGNDIGLLHIQQMFQNMTATTNSATIISPTNRILYMSLGYERNIYWQKVPSPFDVIPIPYVVTNALPTKITTPISMQQQQQQHHHQPSATIESNFVPPKYHSLPERPMTIFYVGDTRPNAVKWSGCNRTALLLPIIEYYNKNSFAASTSTSNNKSNHNDVRVYVRLIDSFRRQRRNNNNNTNNSRLSTVEYNDMMAHSKYCLILCGDTPTSRSFSSAIVHGCIPLFIGKERWYGYCGSRTNNKNRSPSTCHAGWGWNVLHDQNWNDDTIMTQYKHPRQNMESSIRAQRHHTTKVASHFPYDTIFDYRGFPSIDEDAFRQDPVQALQRFLKESSFPTSSSYSFESMVRWKDEYIHCKMIKHGAIQTEHPDLTKEISRNRMDDEFRSAFIYGYGHPVTTQFFGNAVQYIHESIVHHLNININ